MQLFPGHTFVFLLTIFNTSQFAFSSFSPQVQRDQKPTTQLLPGIEAEISPTSSVLKNVQYRRIIQCIKQLNKMEVKAKSFQAKNNDISLSLEGKYAVQYYKCKEQLQAWKRQIRDMRKKD